MKQKITLLATAAFISFSSIKAQTQCNDLNGFVEYKNQGTTGAYHLSIGQEEYSGQTYHYSGSGKITSVRVYGNYPNTFGGVPLKIGIYNVDANGRPTTLVQSVNTVWWTFDNFNGYVNVNFPSGGVNINHDFAVTAQILNTFPYGNEFNLRYTGDGEGKGQDLASLAGTSTGFNWSSAKTNFSKDGDFYLVPKMTHLFNSSFTISSLCNNTGAPVSFHNTTVMTKDSMFNKIGLAAYSGSNHFSSWNFGDGSPVSYVTDAVHTYTAPGVYTVALTSAIEGWNSFCTTTYTAKVSVGLNVTATSISNVSCNGGNNGSFVAVGQFGAPNYEYSLNGITYQSSPNFNGLSAGVKTVYVKDALGCVKSTTLAITEPSAISFVSASSTNASCGNSDGSILVSATGGVGALQYRLNGGTYQSAGAFNNYPIGVYNMTVKDANACTTSTNVLINDQGGPAISNINFTQISCNGGNDGSITVTSTGGTGSVLYSINGGLSFQTNNTFLNVTAGTHAVMIKDASNCTDISTISINQPQALTLQASSSPALCNGSNSGQINVMASSGGIGLHKYSLNGVNYQSGLNFSGLAAGTYTVYVKDIANCVGNKTISISQPAPLTASVSLTSASCYGSSDGGLVVHATGGDGWYQYSLNDGENYQYSNMFEELGAGEYNIMIKDGNNCTYYKTSMIGEPAAITTTVSTTNSTCGNTNGGILVLANGGSGSFQYSLDGTNFNTTGVFNPLASKTYYVIVKDNTGCTKVVPATIVDSNGPSIVSLASTNISCHAGNDGSINVTNVTGGFGTLEYSINGSNFQTSNTFSSLHAGNYEVIVKDANGCTGTHTVALTQPNGFLINPIVTNAVCNSGTGSANITAAGGAGVLAYSINNGASYQSSSAFNALSAGNYTVLVRDAANCVGTQSFIVTQPTGIQLSFGILNVACNEQNTGEITVTANGGTGALTYNINNGPFSANHEFHNLTGNATYTISVKDANNCIQSQTAYVNQPAQLSIIPTKSDVTCTGGNNGAINLSLSGGVYPYTFEWSNAQTTQGIFNLTANTYSVVVTDYNGCSANRSFTIAQPANPLIVNAVVTNASNGSTNDGKIDATVTGGVQPYSFSWSNAAITEDLNDLLPGAYLVTVRDNNGCITSSTYNVNNALGVNEIQISGNEISVYPNPAREFTTIEAKGLQIDKLEIVNVLGQKVLYSEPKSTKTEINISDLESGIYFVKVYVNNTYAIKRIDIVK